MLFLSFSCKKKEIPSLATYKIKKLDFESIISIPGYVDPLNSVSVACPGQVNGTIISLVNDGIMVNKGDTVCVLENAEVLAEILDIETKLKSAEMDIIKLKATQALKQALLEAEVKTNNAETLIANLDSLQLKFNSPNQRKIKELELKIAKIKKSKLQKRVKSLAKIQQSELRGKEFQTKRMVARLESANQRISQLTLTAPASGIVIISKHFITRKKMNVGDPVWPNMSIISIPTNDKFKIKIESSEEKFKLITEGNPVEYTFDAMPENVGWGNITQKSPVGRPVKKDSKIKIFEIEASLDSFKTMPEPGFTCECKIRLLQLKDTIVIPHVALFEQDSIKVVYVVNPTGFELRQVKTGLSSNKEIVISMGLKVNETITLSKPEDEFINKKTVLKKIKIAKPSTAKKQIQKIK
jgi:multidrug efflux pump subunit AcrA (membrane-fusion protein)